MAYIPSEVRSDQHANLEVPSSLFTLAPWHGVPENWGQEQRERALWGCGASLPAVGLFFFSLPLTPHPSAQASVHFTQRFQVDGCVRPVPIFSPQMVSSHSVPFEIDSQQSSAEEQAHCSSGNSLFCSLCAHWGAFRSLRLPNKFWIQASHCQFGEGCRNNCLGAETDILAQLIWCQH